MKLRKIIIGGVLFLASCGGGGSNGPASAIDGFWKGNLVGGAIICSDGGSTGISAGQFLRELVLDVTGSDELNSIVQAIDGECILEGKRTANGFTASPVSGCPLDLLKINFSLQADNEAVVNYDYAPQVNNGISDSTRQR